MLYVIHIYIKKIKAMFILSCVSFYLIAKVLVYWILLILCVKRDESRYWYFKMAWYITGYHLWMDSGTEKENRKNVSWLQFCTKWPFQIPNLPKQSDHKILLEWAGKKHVDCGNARTRTSMPSTLTLSFDWNIRN